MKHAREDYNRIQDPAGLIPEDEPVLLVRAQDKHFGLVARFYQLLVKMDDGDQRIIDAIESHLPLADAWPVKKSPDMPGAG